MPEIRAGSYHGLHLRAGADNRRINNEYCLVRRKGKPSFAVDMGLGSKSKGKAKKASARSESRPSPSHVEHEKVAPDGGFESRAPPAYDEFPKDMPRDYGEVPATPAYERVPSVAPNSHHQARLPHTYEEAASVAPSARSRARSPPAYDESPRPAPSAHSNPRARPLDYDQMSRAHGPPIGGSTSGPGSDGGRSHVSRSHHVSSEARSHAGSRAPSETLSRHRDAGSRSRSERAFHASHPQRPRDSDPRSDYLRVPEGSRSGRDRANALRSEFPDHASTHHARDPSPSAYTVVSMRSSISSSHESRSPAREEERKRARAQFRADLRDPGGRGGSEYSRPDVGKDRAYRGR